MTWISLLALFFIVWWTALFIALPFGVRTQDDDGDVTLGTVSSAPRGPHMLKVVIRTTIASIIVCGILYGVTRGLGYGFDDLPRVVPEFDGV
jgi:predicted secreted protein